MENEKYQGWANYETWSVALWLRNDEFLYNLAKKHIGLSYQNLVNELAKLGKIKTGDGVRYDDKKIKASEVEAFFME